MKHDELLDRCVRRYLTGLKVSRAHGMANAIALYEQLAWNLMALPVPRTGTFLIYTREYGFEEACWVNDKILNLQSEERQPLRWRPLPPPPDLSVKD